MSVENTTSLKDLDTIHEMDHGWVEFGVFFGVAAVIIVPAVIWWLKSRPSNMHDLDNGYGD